MFTCQHIGVRVGHCVWLDGASMAMCAPMTAQIVTMAKNFLGASRQHSSIRRNLLATLLSSWMMAPLGMLVLHLAGLGGNRYLVLILVALGVGAPFQLMLNELLAVGHARDRYSESRRQVALLSLINLGAGLLAVGTTHPGVPGSGFAIDGVTVAVLVTVNLILSYAAVLLYTRLVLLHRIDTVQSIINGGLVGGVVVVLYALAGVTGARIFLTLVLVVPGALHLLYFYRLYRRMDGERRSETTRAGGMVGTGSLLCGAILLVGTTYLASILRFHLVGGYPEYAALLLVTVNVISTAMFTLARFSFLAQLRNKNATKAAYAALISFGMSIVAYVIKAEVAAFFAIVAINFVNLWIIELLRRQSNMRARPEGQFLNV